MLTQVLLFALLGPLMVIPFMLGRMQKQRIKLRHSSSDKD